MARKSDNYDLLHGTVWKKLLRFFFPIAVGSIIQQLYNAADGLIVGRFVGTEALAAVGGSAAQLTIMIVTVFVALTSGASVITAQLYGASKMRKVRASVANILTVFTLVGIVIGAIGYILTPSILELLKTPAETMEDAVLYLRIYFPGVVFILLLNMESGILRAVGDSRSPFICMTICCLTNIILDYIFVVYFGWAVAGVAIATVFSQFLNVVLLTIRLLTSQEPYHILDPTLLSLKGEHLKAMLTLGIPAGAQAMVYSVANMVIQVGVNSLGTIFVASWAMSSRVDGIFWSLSNAMGAAITTFIGQNYGAGLMDRVKQCVKQGFIMAQIMTILLSTGLLVLSYPVLRILSTDPGVIETTHVIMWWFVPFYFIWTVIEVLTAVLRGAGDAVVPVVITVLGVGVFRILWQIIVFPLDPSLMTLALNYLLSWLITAIGIFIYYKKGKWLENKVI